MFGQSGDKPYLPRGGDVDEAERVDSIRTLVWYKRYKKLADKLMDIALEPGEAAATNIKEAMELIHATINDAHGYGYHHVAVSARDSMYQALEDVKRERL